MRRIWRYDLDLDPITVELWNPRVVLVAHEPTLNTRNGQLPTIWIEHEDAVTPRVQAAIEQGLKPDQRSYLAVGTDHPYGDNLIFTHVGSAICGPYVWHVIERRAWRRARSR